MQEAKFAEKKQRKSMNCLFKVRFCKGAQRAPQIHGSETLKKKSQRELLHCCVFFSPNDTRRS